MDVSFVIRENLRPVSDEKEGDLQAVWPSPTPGAISSSDRDDLSEICHSVHSRRSALYGLWQILKSNIVKIA